jgi:phage baseplate assembly protein W
MPKETPGLVFPLEFTDDNAGYKLSEVTEAVQFNIKNIILTNPGERIMLPSFGVGIKQALFEFGTFELLEKIQDRIIQQLNIYAPYITILDLNISAIDGSSINLKLKYEIDFAEIVDTFEIDITNI